MLEKFVIILRTSSRQGEKAIFCERLSNHHRVNFFRHEDLVTTFTNEVKHEGDLAHIGSRTCKLYTSQKRRVTGLS